MRSTQSESWQKLHHHYTKIKNDYQLYSCDIIRQLGHIHSISYNDYLSENGWRRNPAAKQGTVGGKLRDILTSGLSKIDWSLSTASYIDKLHELPIDHCYMHYSVKNEKECGEGAVPELEIGLTMDEGVMMSKEELSRYFTIDGVVPIIVEITKMYQAVLRNYDYVAIGDQ